MTPGSDLRENEMQVDHKRACASCGAENTLDAAFCWKCFATFATAQPQMPPAPKGGWGPASPAAPAAPKSGSRGSRTLAIVIGAVLAVVVGGVVRNVLRPDYHVPDALPGLARIETSQTQDFERRMQAEAVRNNVELEVALYGSSSVPRVYLVLANGKAVEDTDQLFREFLGGVESSGAVVDREAQLVGSHEVAEWRCVPVRAAALTASVCMWREDASVGMTLDLEPGDDLSGALLDAYDASHA
jgi:ribosomal protein L40E